MDDKLITLTLVFHSTAQAHHVLEAYHEAMGFGSATGVTVQSASPEVPAYVPTTDAPVEDDEDEAAEVERDERGVPYNEAFHSGSKKQSKGAWNRKKGHDRVAADAWEAQYLTVGNAPASPGAPQVNAPGSAIPTSQEFQDYWVWCCGNNKVSMADQQHIEQTWGGHPMSAVFMDAGKRTQAMTYLRNRAGA